MLPNDSKCYQILLLWVILGWKIIHKLNNDYRFNASFVASSSKVWNYIHVEILLDSILFKNKDFYEASFSSTEWYIVHI